MKHSPGNHDENIREYDGYVFGEIVVRNSDVHVTASGQKFLVIRNYSVLSEARKKSNIPQENP
jgi:UDP-2,3-diacylglucosamine pyrophosphatase LpxH